MTAESKDSPKQKCTAAQMADDQEAIMFLKVFPCDKDYNHDFAGCFNHHNNDKERRRCLLAQTYSSKMCPEFKNTGHCPRGDACSMAHNTFEYWVHPQRFRTKMCKEGAKCSRPFCFFAHKEAELRQPSEAPRPLASFANMLSSNSCAADQLAACGLSSGGGSSSGGGNKQGCATAWQPPLSPSTPKQQPLIVIPQHMLQRLPQLQQQQLPDLQQQQLQAANLSSSSGLLPTMNLADCMNLNNISGGQSSSGSSVSPRSCTGNSNSSNVLPVLLEAPPAPFQNFQQQPNTSNLTSFYGPSAAPQSDMLPPGAFVQQQQGQQQQQLEEALSDTLAAMDPAVLAALLQQLDIDSRSAPACRYSLAGDVAAAAATAQPPPPPRPSRVSSTAAAGSGSSVYSLSPLPQQQLLFADLGTVGMPVTAVAATVGPAPATALFSGDMLQLAGPSVGMGGALPAAALPSCQTSSHGLGFTAVPATMGMMVNPPGLNGAGSTMGGFRVQW